MESAVPSERRTLRLDLILKESVWGVTLHSSLFEYPTSFPSMSQPADTTALDRAERGPGTNLLLQGQPPFCPHTVNTLYS